MVTVAQIGVGYWNLLRNLVANENCIVKSVADLSKERRNYVSKLYPSIKTTDNVDDMNETYRIEFFASYKTAIRVS